MWMCVLSSALICNALAWRCSRRRGNDYNKLRLRLLFIYYVIHSVCFVVQSLECACKSTHRIWPRPDPSRISFLASHIYIYIYIYIHRFTYIYMYIHLYRGQPLTRWFPPRWVATTTAVTKTTTTTTTNTTTTITTTASTICYILSTLYFVVFKVFIAHAPQLFAPDSGRAGAGFFLRWAAIDSPCECEHNNPIP